jgi:hypothetical protein
MKILKSISKLILLCIFATTAFGQVDTSTVAKAASSAWLEKLDGSDIGGTWDSAASMFKSAITREAWSKAAQAARGPLGKVKSRTEKSATSLSSLPGVPDGQYFVLQYDTEFENKSASVETITMALDSDKEWRVAGYFIK